MKKKIKISHWIVGIIIFTLGLAFMLDSVYHIGFINGWVLAHEAQRAIGCICPNIPLT